MYRVVWGSSLGRAGEPDTVVVDPRQPVNEIHLQQHAGEPSLGADGRGVVEPGAGGVVEEDPGTPPPAQGDRHAEGRRLWHFDETEAVR